MRILLGHSDGNVTHVHTPEGHTLRDIFNDLADLWPQHGGEADPAWVAAEDPAAASAIASLYPGAEVKTLEEGDQATEYVLANPVSPPPEPAETTDTVTARSNVEA